MRIKSRYKSENAPLQKEERLGAQTDSKPCLSMGTKKDAMHFFTLGLELPHFLCILLINYFFSNLLNRKF